MIFGSKKAQEKRDKIIQYKRVFGTPEGKAVLFDILNRCNILSTHRGDPFEEGKRSAALDILHYCNINMADFDRALKGDLE